MAIPLLAYTICCISANSLISDSLSFISDLFYYIPTLETSIGQIISDRLNGKTVKQYLYDLRAIFVFSSLGINILAFLAKDLIFPYFDWTNSLTESQFGYSLLFLGFNLAESVSKFILYSAKSNNRPVGTNYESNIYIEGATLDTGQTLFTVLGII